MWKCEKCETINEGEFCAICGEKKPEQHTIQSNQQISNNFVSEESAEREGSSGRGVYVNAKLLISFLVTIIIVLIICFAGMFIYIINQDKEKPTPTAYQPTPTAYQPTPTENQPTPTVYQPTPTVYRPAPTESAVINSPAYKRVVDNTYSYYCDVPSDFIQIENGNRKVYVSEDDQAIMRLEATRNTYNSTVQNEMDAFIRKTGGEVRYKSNGDDWFAVSIKKDGNWYYIKGFVDHYIRTFTMDFPDTYLNIYGDYVEHIEDNFKRTDVQ